VTGNIHSGFTAEFTPRDVGAHSITVEYNGHPVSGTPFIAKAYDAKRVFVGPLPKGSVGKTLQFMGENYNSHLCNLYPTEFMNLFRKKKRDFSSVIYLKTLCIT
jgi:hypothetical protein